MQTDYNTPSYPEQPSLTGQLGNSFVEFNAQVEPHQASCITCHSYSARNIDNCMPSDMVFSDMPSNRYPSVGYPGSLPKDYKKLDFSWFLAFSVPGNPERNHPKCKKIKS